MLHAAVAHDEDQVDRFAEKQREDALRDLGWQVVRWLWADLYRPGVIRDRVLRAFARAGRPHHTA